MTHPGGGAAFIKTIQGGACFIEWDEANQQITRCVTPFGGMRQVGRLLAAELAEGRGRAVVVKQDVYLVAEPASGRPDAQVIRVEGNVEFEGYYAVPMGALTLADGHPTQEKHHAEVRAGVSPG